VEKVYDLPMRKPIHMNAAQAAEYVAIFIHKKKRTLMTVPLKVVLNEK
jgi:hypothetical protein